MLRVYICPDCGSIRPVARRKEVNCYQCDSAMVGLKLTYVEYSEWNQEERRQFANQWLEENRKKNI